jgi:hypothetical protein
VEVEWSFWPQYRKYTIRRVRRVRVGRTHVEEEVTIVLSVPQARKFAKMVIDQSGVRRPAA